MRKTSNALELLNADQQSIAALFASFSMLCAGDATPADKGAVAGAICVAMSVHTQIEEEFFYPALRAAASDAAMIDEVEVEQLLAKDLIAQISSMQAGDALFEARVKVLRKSHERHVIRSESALFPQARISGLDLDGLGAALDARRRQLQSEYQAIEGGRPRFDAAGDAIGRRTLMQGGARPSGALQARVAA